MIPSKVEDLIVTKRGNLIFDPRPPSRLNYTMEKIEPLMYCLQCQSKITILGEVILTSLTCKHGKIKEDQK